MKKRFFKILSIVVVILLMQSNLYFCLAEYDLTVTLQTDKTSVNINQQVQATVSWEEELEAAGFTLRFDSNKLELKSSSLSDDYYNIQPVTGNTDKSDIIVSWAALDEVASTGVTFTFKTIAIETTAEIKIESIQCFANGDLVTPTNVDWTTNGSKTIEIIRFGDVNGDGVITSDDVQKIYDYLNNRSRINRTAKKES